MTASLEQWLHSAGLARYAEAFARNDIDLAILPTLAESELAALGLSLGHRKLLLQALTQRAADAAAPGEDLPAPVSDWSRHAGERKPVTLLFADITGSTALTETLDAEDAHEQLYGAVQQMCEAVEAQRGTVCRFMGDGVMAMFGAPVAFEDHAVRASAAALDLQQRLTCYADALEHEHGCRIQARVGLHAGEVVVLQVGDASTPRYDASGVSVALAARMEQSAAPGSVQMTASTYALVASWFEGSTLDPVTAKGFSEPVPVVRLDRRRPVSASTWVLPFIGRRAEMEQLRALLAVCVHERSGRCVLLRGEPGIGKSRLAGQIANEAAGRGLRVHRSAAIDFGWARGQDPARLLLRDLLGLDADASAPARAVAAAHAIADGLVERAMRAHLLDLLDLPTPAELEAAYGALGAAERAAQRNTLLARVVERAAQREPRLLVIEDVHWVVPAVRAYLVAIARILPDCPALMVLTTRPESESGDGDWDALLGDLPLTLLGLGQLSSQEAHAFAASFAIEDPAIVAACIERSGRNPLFLEQLLRSRLDNSQDALPTSVQSLVAAQVDRLPALDKRAAHAAAVLGKQFDLAALRHLIEAADYDCAALIQHRLVHPEGARLVFYHALVQEGVLSSLLRRDRQGLHRLAAGWYAERDPVLHARHLDLAEDPGAARACLQAARAEVESHRFVFAMGLLTRGLQLVNEHGVEFQLRSLHGEVLTALGRAGESATAYRLAADLTDDPRQRCHAWLGAAEALRTTGEYAAGLELLDHAQAIAAGDADLVLELARVHHMRGNIHFVQLDAVRCEAEQRRAFDLAKVCDAPEMEAWALTGLARGCFMRGRMNSAAAHVEQYLQVCDRHGLEFVRYAQINMQGISLHYKLRFDEALEAFQASREHAPRVGAPRQAIVAMALGADMLVDCGRFEQAAEFAHAGIELSRRVGERSYEPIAHALAVRVEERDSALAERELHAIWERLDARARHFSGWWVLASMMRVTRGAAQRSWALAQARELSRAQSFGMGAVRFLHDAIIAALVVGERVQAAELAARLQAFVAADVSPLTDLHLRWARAVTAEERDAIRAEAARAHLDTMVRAIDAARA